MERHSASPRDLNTEAIDAACDLLEGGDYEAVDRIIWGTLPRLSETAYEERIRIYMLLLALPDRPIGTSIQEDALRVARHIIDHREEFSVRYRLWAYMIFDTYKGKWTPDSERNEYFAVNEAQAVLVHQCSREDRDVALTVIASQSPDEDQIKLCLNELLHEANAFAITQAVTSAPVAFHKHTNLEYLERALDQVKSPGGFVADILRKKMETVIAIMEEDIEEENLDRQDLHVKLVMCYCNLRMIPGAYMQQTYSEYYLAYAAAYLDEPELGLIHAYTAIAMARRLRMSHLEQLGIAVRDHLQERAPYESESDEKYGS